MTLTRETSWQEPDKSMLQEVIGLDIPICMIGDMGYDSSQGPAPAIGTNRRELMLYQFVLF